MGMKNMTSGPADEVKGRGSCDALGDRIREMSWGYRPAILLLTANRLRIFDALDKEPAAADDLARRLGSDARTVTILLDALAAMGLLVKRRGLYRCRAGVEDYLVTGGSRYQGNILNHRFNVFERWIDLLRVVKEGGPAEVMRSRRTPDEWHDFILGMDDVARQSIDALLGALDLSGRKRLLDLGGGPGTYAIALCRSYPDLRAVIFDLPETVEIARDRIEEHHLERRIETSAGDYLRDPIGRDYDAVLISNIVHSLSLDEFALLAEKVRAAMAPGGLVVVRDFYLDESRTNPLESALFAVNMLVSTEGGNCYTPSEVKGVLRSAGFVRLRMRAISPVSYLYMGSRSKT
jgi:DNA-binding transcriptional ArsR family regulator/SAM-dependent methyltransferase